MGPDPLADWAPGWTPYRYAFNNPINYTDPFGLFESRAAARDYKREHGARGRIRRQDDGSFAIENRRDHSFTQDFGGDVGVQTGALVVERGVHLRDIGLDGFNALSDPYSESYNPNAVVFTDAADIAYAFGSYLGFASPTAKLPTKVGAAGDVSVYVSKSSTGTTQYAGITNNLARRAAEHLATKGINIRPLMQGLTRSDARAIEQALIEIHGLQKNGGTLLNKINSISPKNPIYKDQLKRGYELLQSIGYK